MRSPRELIALALLAAAMAANAGEPVAAPVERVTRVVGEMKADPALNGHHTEHELRWKNLDPRKRERSDMPPWLFRLARWLADAGRGVVWVLGAVLVALIAVFAWRWASVRADALRAQSGLRPSFVNELDIRPESLPADIAAAARALCQRGETRAALSLLYRGALSRLVHDRLVPILGSSTEGECVRLAARVLPAAGAAYFERLVGAWQTEVYAGRAADAGTVATLCVEFDAHFAPAPVDTPAAMRLAT
ncbi:MAG: DUF4129 domain-containing protein [Burkholderiales bacterium]